MSNLVNNYAGSLLESLADPAVVAVVEARLEAGTAVWGRSQEHEGWVLLSLVQGERTALLEIVHTPGEGDDVEISEEILKPAGF